MRLPFAALLAVLALPAAAETAKQTTLSGKVGRSNVQVRLILHPQADGCAPALLEEVRREALELGQAHVRENLAKLIKQAGTDASGDREFFGLSYLAGCPNDGSAWIAFPAEGREKSLTRYAPQLGWSPMTKLTTSR